MFKNFYKIANVFKVIFLLGYVALTVWIFIYTLITGYTILFAICILTGILLFFALVNFRLNEFNEPVKWLISIGKWTLVVVVIFLYFRISGGDFVMGFLMTLGFLIPALLVLLVPDIVRGTAGGIMRLIYPEDTVEVQKDYSIAKKYIVQHKFKEAIEEYRNVLKEDPKDANAQFEIANIYADYLKDYPSAIEEFDKTLTMELDDSSWVLIHNRLADIYSQRMNDTSSAIERLERIISKFPPDHKYTRQAQQRIKFLREHSLNT